MKQYLLIFWQWLVKSSTDPQATSLTVKGLLAGAATFVVFAAPMLHLEVTAQQYGAFTDAIVLITENICIAVSSIATVFGIVRKIILTIQGQNKVLNSNNNS